MKIRWTTFALKAAELRALTSRERMHIEADAEVHAVHHGWPEAIVASVDVQLEVKKRVLAARGNKAREVGA